MTGTVALAHFLELDMVEAVVVLVVVGQEVAQVQAAVVAPQEGPIQVYSPLPLVVHRRAVEVGVAPATALAAADTVAVYLLAVEAQAIPLVAQEVGEDMDPTAAEAPPLDVEVDIQAVPAEVMALHSHLQVEGDIPMAPHHHRIVSHLLVVPATAKEAMTPRHIDY